VLALALIWSAMTAIHILLMLSVDLLFHHYQDLAQHRLQAILIPQVTGDSNTGVGLVNRYEYTEITAPVTFTILDADRESGTVINPWNFEIKDKSGDCDGTNTISIVREDGQPIEGANPLIINVSFGGVALYSDGTDVYTQGGTV